MELEREPEQQEAEPALPESRQLSIDLDEVEEDAKEEKAQAAATPEDRKTRRQQGRDFRRQKQEYESRLTALQTELAELRGRVSAPPAPVAQPTPGQDPADAEIASLETQQSALLAAIQTQGVPQEQVTKLVDAWKQLERKKRRLEFDQYEKEKKKDAPGADQQRAQHIQASLEAEFPQVYADDYLRLLAQAEFAGLIKRGKPDGLATAREACQRALGRAGLGRPIPGPSELERTRLSGTPARAGTNGGTGNQYTPSRFEINTAKAWTKGRDDLSDEERWRIWAQATGNMPRKAG